MQCRQQLSTRAKKACKRSRVSTICGKKYPGHILLLLRQKRSQALWTKDGSNLFRQQSTRYICFFTFCRLLQPFTSSATGVRTDAACCIMERRALCCVATNYETDTYIVNTGKVAMRAKNKNIQTQAVILWMKKKKENKNKLEREVCTGITLSRLPLE